LRLKGGTPWGEEKASRVHWLLEDLKQASKSLTAEQFQDLELKWLPPEDKT
jgi:hypothetical protein